MPRILRGCLAASMFFLMSGCNDASNGGGFSSAESTGGVGQSTQATDLRTSEGLRTANTLTSLEAKRVLDLYLAQRCSQGAETTPSNEPAWGTFFYATNLGNAGGPYNAAAEAAARWFQDNISQRPGAKKIFEGTDRTGGSYGGGTGYRRTYEIDVGGRAFQYTIVQSPERMMSWHRGIAVKIFGCEAAPESRILDVTMDSTDEKRARVVFSLSRPSAVFPGLPPRPASEGPLDFLRVRQVPQDRRFEARFQRLDATGWELHGRPDET